MNGVVLFVDGAFSFAHRRPGFGWVAVDSSRGCELGRDWGAVRNDGSNNLFAEAAAAAAALEWTLGRGFLQIQLCTDFEGLRHHVRSEPKARHCQARRLFGLYQFVAAIMPVDIFCVPASNPYLIAAHHLAQCGMAEASVANGRADDVGLHTSERLPAAVIYPA